MNRFHLGVVLALVALLGACSGAGRREAPAPVEDARVRPPPPPELPAVEPLRQPPAPVIEMLPPAAPSGEMTAPDAAPSVAPAPRMPTRTGTAVLALVGEAEGYRQGGELQRSAASLERALRIEPRNPYLWNRLARVRLEQGRVGEAGDLAAKSNTLAGGDNALKRDNWQLIAAARRSAGDWAGARAAQHKAESLSR